MTSSADLEGHSDLALSAAEPPALLPEAVLLTGAERTDGPRASEAVLAPGAVLGRLYRVRRLIGRGAQGEVYEVEHINMGTRFAAKVLNREVAHDGELLARLQREAKTTSQLDHPNIVRVVNFDTAEDGRSFVVMELFSGESLDARIARGPMPVSEVCAIGLEVASALSAAHARGIVHRDVKPANVFLAETSLGRAAKVMDFGIAKVARDTEDIKLTRAGAVVGTPAYMAPEQISGERPIDHRVDIYAMGCMLFEMLCGRPPFVADSVLEVLVQHVRDPVPSVRTFRTDVPLKLEGILRQCLAKDPDHRFATLEMLANELQGVPTGGSRRPSTAPAPRSTSTAPAPRSPSTAPRAVGAGKPAPPTRAELGLDLKLPDTSASARSEVKRNLQLAGVLVGLMAAWTVGAKVMKALAPAPPEAPVTVNVTLLSDPPGAQVLLRSKEVGVTPFVFPLRYGTFGIELDVKLAGYEPKTVSIVPDRERVERFVLVPIFKPKEPPRPLAPSFEVEVPTPPVPPRPDPGYLTVVAESPADAYIDGRPVGRLPLKRLELPPGRHEVVLRGRKGESRTVPVKIEVSVESTYNLNLGWRSSRYDWDDRGRRR